MVKKTPKKKPQKPVAVGKKKVSTKTVQRHAPSLTRGFYVIYCTPAKEYFNIDDNYGPAIFEARKFSTKKEAEKILDRLKEAVSLDLVSVSAGNDLSRYIESSRVTPLADLAKTIYAFDEDGYMVMEIAAKDYPCDPAECDFRKAKARARERHLLIIQDQKEKLKQAIAEFEKIRREALADIYSSEVRLKKFDRNAAEAGMKG